MSDFVTGLLVVFSEVGFILLIVIVIIVLTTFKRQRQRKNLALALVEKIKQQDPEHKNKLMTLLKDGVGLDEEYAASKAASLLKHEKAVYRHILNIFMGHERDELASFDEYMNTLLNEYYELFENDDEAEGDTESIVVKTRKENHQLREEKAQLRTHLDVAMTTMENMMGEYASMYEGGHDEDSEQRAKNAMYKIKKDLDDMPSDSTGAESEDEDSNEKVDFDINMEEDLLSSDEDIPELGEEVVDEPEKKD